MSDTETPIHYKKAITITPKTIGAVAARFNVEPDDIEARLPLDHIVVTDFGNDETFEVLDSVKFNELFIRSSDLENGWYHAEPKT